MRDPPVAPDVAAAPSLDPSYGSGAGNEPARNCVVVRAVRHLVVDARHREAGDGLVPVDLMAATEARIRLR